MRQRSLRPEILDDPLVSERELVSTLSFMPFVNRFFGGARVVLDYFSAPSVPRSFHVLDLGTGAGDIPQALARWARARGREARVTALDLNPACVAYAEKNYPDPSVHHIVGSAFDIESLGLFDYVISSMFFHHLGDESIVRLLKLAGRAGKRGFLVNDLYRSVAGYAGALALALPTGKRIVIHDAPLSVAKAFRRADFERYKFEAGFPDAQVELKPWFRITLSRHA